MNDKAVGGICGALLTNVAGWMSGVFIPIDLIGGTFKTVANILPFYHAVKAIQSTLDGRFMILYLFYLFLIVYILNDNHNKFYSE